MDVIHMWPENYIMALEENNTWEKWDHTLISESLR